MDKTDIQLIKQKEQKEQELRDIAGSLSFSREFKIYFKEIEDFHRLHGHFRVPIRHRTEDDLPFGKFMIKLRQEYNRWKAYQERAKNKKGAISDIRSRRFLKADNDMFKQLEKLDFDKSLISVKSEWDRGYDQLERFYKLNGHAYVKPRFKFGDNKFELGTWVTYQRVQRRKNNLSPEKIHKLNNLNFLWTVDLEEVLSIGDKVDSITRDTRLNLRRLFNKTSNANKYEHQSEIINNKRKELGVINDKTLILQRNKQSKELRRKGFEGLLKDVLVREQSIRREQDEWLPHPPSDIEKSKLERTCAETNELRKSIEGQMSVLTSEINEICHEIEELDAMKYKIISDIEALNKQLHKLVK